MPLTRRQLARVSTVLLDEVRAFAPDWTGSNESDPGVTLLELFAFLTEGLVFRQGAPPPRAVEEAKRLARAALALTPASAPGGCGLRRVNYFSGQVLGEADFRDEQDYFRARLARRNRFLLGSGVVSGLEVSVVPAGAGGQGQVVTVEPGLAIDARGEEIEVCEAASAALPAPSGLLFVELSYVETPAAPVPAIPPESGDQFSRVEESFTIRLSPVAGPDSVAIARLIAARGHWRVDRRFRPITVLGSRG
jgi:hypothetical protein